MQCGEVLPTERTRALTVAIGANQHIHPALKQMLASAAVTRARSKGKLRGVRHPDASGATKGGEVRCGAMHMGDAEIKANNGLNSKRTRT
jgi:hypothetical protein